MARRPVSDDEVQAASDLLERHYREWVQATALDLAEAVINGEAEDREQLYDRVREVCDSASSTTLRFGQRRKLSVKMVADLFPQHVIHDVKLLG